MPKKYKVEVIKKNNRKWFWRVREANGNILLTSQIYRSDPHEAVENFMNHLRNCTGPFNINE